MLPDTHTETEEIEDRTFLAHTPSGTQVILSALFSPHCCNLFWVLFPTSHQFILIQVDIFKSHYSAPINIKYHILNLISLISELQSFSKLPDR